MLAADGCVSSAGNPACCFCASRPGGPRVVRSPCSGPLVPHWFVHAHPLSGTGLALVRGEGAWQATDGDDRLMTGYPLDVDIRPAAPGSAGGRAVLTAYFREVVSRHHKRAATDAKVAAAMRAEPSDDLCPPGGLLLVARHDGRVLGCVGLRLLAAGTGEVTRVFVAYGARRRGIGQQLLEAVEDGVRRHRVTRLRLDTSDYLTEARRLYIRNGFRKVAPFTEGRVANCGTRNPSADYPAWPRRRLLRVVREHTLRARPRLLGLGSPLRNVPQKCFVNPFTKRFR